MGQYFLISDPPHSEQLDLMAAAPIFGLSQGEVKIKARFPAPQLLFLEEEKHVAIQKAKQLRQAGFKILVAEETEVSSLPLGNIVTSFRFEPDGLHLRSRDNDFLLPYDARVVVVTCKPIVFGEEYKKFREKEELKKDSTKKKGRSAGLEKILTDAGMMDQEKSLLSGSFERSELGVLASALEEQYRHAFIDIYTAQGREVRRYHAPLADLDFSGLGGREGGNIKQSSELLIEMLQEKFSRALLDRRLMEINYREPIIEGKRLSQLSEKLAADLRGIHIFDFASRICFLINDIRPKPEDLTTVIKVDRRPT